MEPNIRKTYVNLISQNVRGLSQQTKRIESEKKNTYSQTSRLENPEELQLHHNHEKFLFFYCAVALCTIQMLTGD
jgi:hypothetical protein